MDRYEAAQLKKTNGQVKPGLIVVTACSQRSCQDIHIKINFVALYEEGYISIRNERNFIWK